ncbi:MAG: S9 family peptidase [Bdellovibrionales bacterium]
MFKPAKKIPHRMEIHGDVRLDDYFWMRERDSGPVMEYLKQENVRVQEALAPVADLEKKLYWEMRGRIKEEDVSVPVSDSGYHYYTRYQAGQEYPINCRKKGSLEAPEDTILDQNAAAAGHAYFQVGGAHVSPDQRLLGYAVDTVGRRIYNLCFKDLETGELLPDKITGITSNFVWAADSRTLFYVRQDPETLRAYQVFRYELGSDHHELVYEEKDTTFNVGVEASKTHEWLFLSSYKRDAVEYRLLPGTQPRGLWEVFWPREMGHEYHLVDGGDRLFILTNWDAINFRVMEAPHSVRDKREWKEVVAHDPKIFREGLDAYRSYLVVSERENGLPQIRVLARETGVSRMLKFPDPAYEVSARSLPDFHSPFLRFDYESLAHPPAVFDEDFRTGERTLRKVREVPGYNMGLYETRRIWATAADGARIPISVLLRKDTRPSGPAPLLLYGYGSYGLSTDVRFWSSMFSLVDRGFVFAQAHVRGGSEMGREWYEKGRLQHKMNTFTDFIACGETLIQEGYTSRDHLHIMGGSAGGLLVGAVMNLRPDLFKSVIAMVPFVDVLTTMLDESLPLTTGEYNEWGDPRLPEPYMWMRKYSPYDNIEAKNYPHVMVTTGYHDSQVQYWEPAKWVAKLREMKTDPNLLLFYTELEAGHSGASGRFESLKTLAKVLAFILMLEGHKD